MEYVFGTQKNIEVLKTKGSTHTNLTGFHQLELSYPDQIITENFHIVQKIRDAEDVEGNCYDWYEIDHHSRYTDKFTPQKEEIETNITDTQDALCEATEDFEQRIADIEDALCEITEMEG